jgi:hypothetical protein
MTNLGPTRTCPGRQRSFTTRLAAALVVVSTAVLAGCEGDTLYDGDITGPNLALTPHSLALVAAVPDRVEATDSIPVIVRFRDERSAGGVERVGITTLVFSPAGDTLAFLVQVHTFPVPRLGVDSVAFAIPAARFASATPPDTVQLEVHAFAITAAGSCAAAISTAEERFACRAVDGGFVAHDAAAPRRTVLVTLGRTFLLPRRGTIADALATVAGTPRLFLSNLTNHTVEVLDLLSTREGGTPQWQSVRVGSEPWGMTLDNTGTQLLVANSGGTSISSVPLSTLVENPATRIRSPNTPLWEVTVTTDTLGRPRYEAAFYDFSDRPQFLAQDQTGLLLYSTVPTPAAASGTIRLAEVQPGWQQPEVRLLFTGRAISSSPNHWALAHIDSARVFVTPNEDLINLYDHIPGFPGQIIQSGPLPIDQAITSLAAQGSDLHARRGQWVLREIGLSDTTFVAASGDRRHVAFGEGAVAPAGRIIMWDAQTRTVSNEISVADLVNNASERVQGLGLNENGTLGVARGTQGAYFFDASLRLQGLSRQGLSGGSGGATLRPASFTSSTLAFVGTGRRSIQVIETDHYQPVLEIPIRDDIAGPLRASPPLPQDNAGLVCPGSPACVVVKLYAVTAAGGVVVVDVRERDLQR